MGKNLISRASFALLVALPLSAQTTAASNLETTTFVVMGEGLAAGMANYGLSTAVQSGSFPALVARQMKTAFPQPLIESPGIGDILGHPNLPVRLPTYPQTTVRIFPRQPNPNDNAPTLFVFNVSVPQMTLSDSIRRLPVPPLVQRDSYQTVLNMILGFPALILNNNVPLWSQLEYAKAMFPTVALVELGYYEALSAAVHGNPAEMPDPGTFATDYGLVVKSLRNLQTQVVATTIPDPLDTAYFSSTAQAAAILKSTAEVLSANYGIVPGDYVTPNGLTEIAMRMATKKITPLPSGSVLKASDALQISGRVQALNARISEVATAQGAVLYDLGALFRTVRTAGVQAGTRRLTSGYLGGFYSLDGYYPAATGHALIANDLIGFLNSKYRTTFATVDLNPILADDSGLRSLISAPAPLAGKRVDSGTEGGSN